MRTRRRRSSFEASRFSSQMNKPWLPQISPPSLQPPPPALTAKVTTSTQYHSCPQIALKFTGFTDQGLVPFWLSLAADCGPARDTRYNLLVTSKTPVAIFFASSTNLRYWYIIIILFIFRRV